MNLLGPELLVVLVLMSCVVGAGTMLLAMRTTLRRNRATRDHRADGADEPQE